MRVGLLVVDGMATSGYAAIRDVLDAADLLAPRVGAPRPLSAVRTYGPTPTVRTAHGLDLAAEPLAALVDEPPDVLVTPSVGLVTAEEVVDAVRVSEAVPHLSALHEAGTELAGACSGTFFLAEAGLLDGRECTTSWWLGPAFRARYPRAALDEQRSLVVDGGVSTAGAAFAHIDLAMSLVHRTSPALTGLVASYLAVGDRPHQGHVAVPAALVGADPVLSGFDRHVRDHLAEPFVLDDAARAVGVSRRTLQRATADGLGLTPVRYVQQVRLERAVHLLRTTDRSLDAVAAEVGYRDGSTLRSLLRRRRGTTVGEVRRRGPSA